MSETRGEDDAGLIGPGAAERPGRLVPERKQILALSGGGYRGLFTASLLSRLEGEARKRNPTVLLRDKFDVIAGTSAGAILAAGVALGMDAGILCAKFDAGARKLFTVRFPVLRDAKRWFTAPYSVKALRACIEETLGADASRRLDAIDASLLITAVSEGERAPRRFRSKGLAGHKADKTTIADAIVASAAAPTYFGPVKVGEQTLIDGGLIANAPDMAALTDALALKRFSFPDLYLLSIGAASPDAPGRIGDVGAPGKLAWIALRSMVHLTLGAQERLAVALASELIGARHLRLAVAQARCRGVGIGLRRPRPAPKVVAFVAAQPLDELYVSAVTFAEIRFGFETQADPIRRTELNDWLAHRPMFEGRALAISEAVMLRWRMLVEEGRKVGRLFAARSHHRRYRARARFHARHPRHRRLSAHGRKAP